MNRFRFVVILLFSFSMFGCAAMEEALNSIEGEYTQVNAVTGKAEVNKFTLEEENQIGRQWEKQRIQNYRSQGHQVDADSMALARIRRIGEKITRVSHLPDLPWRFHHVNKNDWNANATFSGLIFVYDGLLKDVSDIELAAVLGHEVAHVTCRHLSEQASQKEVTGMFSEKAMNDYYQASFNTEQEAQADRVGLLYMALAGYDPTQAYTVWQRVHQRYGSRPGDFKYAHPLPIDRMNMLKRLGPVAAQYYKGSGWVNPEHKKIVLNNALIKRSVASEDSTVRLLSAGLESYQRHQKTKQEMERRTRLASTPSLSSQDLYNHGVAAYKSRNYQGSITYFMEILKKDPRSPYAIASMYNVTCCLSLLGQRDAACRALLDSVKAGFHDANHIQNDSDLRNIRQDPRFWEAIRIARANNR